MNKLYVIGEMLIDFTSAGSEGLDGPAVFERSLGFFLSLEVLAISTESEMSA